MPTTYPDHCFNLVRLLSTLAWIAVCTPLSADWPQFRGPQANGHATSSQLPVQWSETENIAWKIPVPGQGHSSPVIAGGQIWLTTAVTEELSETEKQNRLQQAKNPKELHLVASLSLRALCFEASTGRQLHDVELFQIAEPAPIHYTNTYASPTPVLHSGLLLAHFGSYGSAAVNCQTGLVQWRNQELKVEHQNGPGSSPLVWNNLMLVHMDGTDRQFIAALRIQDGSLAWNTERSGEMHPQPEMKKAYCTPVIVNTDQGPELISPAANWVYAYNPTNGSEIWKAHYGDLGFSTVPCPVVGRDMVYVCTSFGKSQLLAVKFGGRGDVTQSHVVWKNGSQIPKKPSLLLMDQKLIVCNDSGIVTCLAAQDGTEIWRARVGGNFSASPLLAGDLVYLFNQEGQTTVFRPGDKLEIVAENQLSEGCHASAAVDGDGLIVRTSSHLYRIETQ